MQLEQSIQPTQPLVPHPPDERGLLTPKGGIEPKTEIKPQSVGYDEFLLNICERIDKELDERAEVRARMYTKHHNYYMGGERRWSYWTKSGFKSIDAKVAKRLFSNNQFAAQMNTLISTLIRSRSRLAITPSPSALDDEEKVSAARVATRTVQSDQREKLSAGFMQREWLHKLLYNFAVRGQWYATEGSTAKARAPIIEEEERQLPGAYLCVDCGMTGPEDRAQQHQESTGHEQIENMPGEMVTVPIHNGYEEVPDGDCLTYSISPYEFDLAPEAYDLPSSPYARWQRRVRMSKVKRAYPKLKIEDLAGGELPIMLRAQQAIRRQRFTEPQKAFGALKTYWISVDEYFEFASQKPFEAVSGFRIEPGTDLSQLCPNGLRLDILDRKILDARPEVKEDCLSYSVFHVDPDSWEGKAMNDAVELQRWIDDIHTLIIQIIGREAMGITTYDKKMFSAGKFTGEVGTVVGVDVPDEKKLPDAVHVIDGKGPSPSLYNALEYVQQSQTNTTQAFPSLSGSNMEGSETARGRIILREQALQGMGPPLYLAAQHDVTWAKQNLKLKKKHWTSERYVPYLQEGEPLGGKWFSASDIDTDFIVDVEVDSWMPVTRLDAIDNLTTYMGGEEAIAQMGGFGGQMVPPAIRKRAAELLNVPPGTNPEEKDLRNARHRYSVLKQIITKITGEQQEPIPPEMNSPLLVPPQMVMAIAQTPSIQPLPNVDMHPVFSNFYREAIKDAVDSDGVENNPLTKAVLMALIAAHDNQGVFDTQKMVAEQVAGQAPAVMAQNAMEDQKAQAGHEQEKEKSGIAHKQSMEKQDKAGEQKLAEIETKGKLETKKKSELAKVKV